MERKIFLLFCLWGVFTVSSFSHESRPLFIHIGELAKGLYDVKVNIPNSVTDNNIPEIRLPTIFVKNEALSSFEKTASGYVENYQFLSDGESLKGDSVFLYFPAFNPSITSILQIDWMDGRSHTMVLGPQEHSFYIPEDISAWTVIHQYLKLGIEHIWAGIDHLLFLLCLIIVVQFNRKLFWTITGFTVAHSITLALSTLGWVRLPIQPVEACIALSIIFLCYEIVHHHVLKSSLTYRYPVLVSSSFGLLHGFGFASVLREIGLPEQNLFEALLFFNIGVEIGQVLFILGYGLLIFILFRILRTASILAHSKKLFLPFIYSIGILASYWFFDRIF
jgi:hypothetical protein